MHPKMIAPTGEGWQPIETLPVSHYAAAQRADRSEVDIYQASATSLLSVSTSKEEDGLIVWRPRSKYGVAGRPQTVLLDSQGI